MDGPLQRAARVGLAVALHLALAALVLRQYLLVRVCDYDGFWHLLTGSIIVATGSVPRTDPFCFTTTGFDWINLNWLAQIIEFRLFQALGFAGPLALSSCLAVAGLALTWLHLRARRAHPLAGLLALALAGWALWAPFGIRPRMWTFTLLAALAWLLARPDPAHRLGPGRAAAMVALLLPWNNLHGGFIYGYGLLALTLAGGVLDGRRATGRWVTGRSLWLAAVLAVGLAGFALHPHGFDALAHTVIYPRRFEPEYFRFTQELQPLELVSSGGAVVLALAALAAAGAALNRRAVRWADVLPLAAFALLAIQVRRGTIPLALLAAPVLAQWWTGALDAGRVRRVGRALAAVLEPAWRTVPATLALLLGAWCVFVVPGRTPPGRVGQIDSPALDPTRYPVEVAHCLRDRVPEGRIFNRFRIGGFLAWHLAPARRIFIDGRGDLHSHGTAFSTYLRVVDLEPDAMQILEDWDIAIVVMEREAPLVGALADDGWETVCEDASYVALRRPALNTSSR